MIGSGETNLKSIPAILESFPGIVGSLEVRVIGESGWTFGVSGRGTARAGRSLSKLPPGPVKVKIFDASGQKRGDATVLILPGEASECAWRVEGDALRFVGGGSCRKI
jgi:hypothetical protein